MQYSKTGQFTANQEKLCKEIANRISKLRRSGCYIFGKGDTLCVQNKRYRAYTTITSFYWQRL